MLVTRLDPLTETPQRGSVIACNDTRLEIIFEERFDLEVSQHWRIDVGRSNISFERMEEAIRRLHYNPSTQEARGASTVDHEVMLQGTYLRDILLHSFPSSVQNSESEESPADEAEHDISTSKSASMDLQGLFKHDARISSWAARYSQPDPVVVEGDPVLEGLNPTQIRAVAMMVNHSFCLVQGVSSHLSVTHPQPKVAHR